jgi:hypothetical protein
MNCYSERAALIQAEAKADAEGNEAMWGALCDRRMDVDDEVLAAPARTNPDRQAKLEILDRLAASMPVEDLVPMVLATNFSH